MSRASSILKGSFQQECSRVGGIADYIYLGDYTCDIDEDNGEFYVCSYIVDQACGSTEERGDMLDFANMNPDDFTDFVPENTYIDNFVPGRGFCLFFDPYSCEFLDGQTALFRDFIRAFIPVVHWIGRKNVDWWWEKNRMLVIRAY